MNIDQLIDFLVFLEKSKKTDREVVDAMSHEVGTYLAWKSSGQCKFEPVYEARREVRDGLFAKVPETNRRQVMLDALETMS